MRTIYLTILSLFLLGCYGNLPPRYCPNEIILEGNLKVEQRIERNMSQRVYHSWMEYLDSTSLNWIRHGPEIQYYINGQEESSLQWKHGLKHGTFNLWYPNGSLKGRGNWFEGKLNGQVIEWDQNGTILEKKTWNFGRLEGWQEIYSAEGKLIHKWYWHKGKKLDKPPLPKE